MNKTIDVSIPHQLGRAEAKARLQGGAERLRSQFGGGGGAGGAGGGGGGQAAQVQENWTGDHAEFRVSAMGQAITGRMDVLDDAIKLSVDLPWVLAMIADKIKGRVEQEGRKLLEKK